MKRSAPAMSPASDAKIASTAISTTKSGIRNFAAFSMPAATPRATMAQVAAMKIE